MSNERVYESEHGGFRIFWYEKSGRRRSKRIRGVDRATAEKLVRQIQAKALLEGFGVEIEAERTTVSEWAERWFQRRQSECAEETWLFQRRFYDSLIAPLLGTRTLAELTADVVGAWLERLRSMRVLEENDGKRSYRRRLGEASVHNAERILAQLRRAAAREGLFGDRERTSPVKPWAGTKAPPTKERFELFGEADFARVLRSAADVGGVRFRMAVLLALFAGHRKGEQSELRWKEHLRRAPDSVCVELGGDAYEVLLGQWTKTGESRYAIVAGDAARLIAEYEKETGGEGYVFGLERDARIRGRVVARKGDAPRTPVLDFKRWNATRELAGLPRGFRVHDLRGAYAKALRASGLERRDVMVALGHRSETTTAIYLKSAVSPAAVRAARALASMRLSGETESK